LTPAAGRVTFEDHDFGQVKTENGLGELGGANAASNEISRSANWVRERPSPVGRANTEFQLLAFSRVGSAPLRP
jgi:hypothetical protein